MDAFRLLGQAELMLGRPQEARTALRQALIIAPDYAGAATMLGNIALQQNWPLAEPVQRLRRASELQPRNLEALAMLVRLDVRVGDLRRAATDLAAAAEALSQRNLSDTRNQQYAQTVMAAAAEAQAAGVPIPNTLLQQEPSY
jgi:tetratricopeptide (TPR) repeat protein